MAGGAIVGALRVDLKLDSAAFEKGMDRATRNMRAARMEMTSMGRGISSAGALVKGAMGGIAAAFTFDAIKNLALDGLDYAASLGEQAQQLGVNAKEMQQYRYAASQVGLSNDEMDQALQRLTRSTGQAAAGAKKPQAAFDLLGVKIRDSAGRIKSAGQLMPELADALAKIPDPARRAAIEVDLFGKTGQKLDGLLSGGSKGINNLRAAAEKMGIVLSDDQIAAADDAADKLSAFKQVLEAKISSWVVSLLPYVQDFLKQAERLGTDGAQWIDGFRERWVDSTGQIDKSTGGMLTKLNELNGGTTFGERWNEQIEALVKRFDEADKALQSLGKWADDTDAAIGRFADRVVKGFGAGTAAARDLYTGVKTWLQDKLTAVFDWVGSKIQWVGDKFKWLDDVVVRHSYIPDMVDSIGAHMRRLDALMVQPAGKAADAVAARFRKLGEELRPLMDELFPEQRAAIELQKKIDTLDEARRLGAQTPAENDAARQRLFDKTMAPTADAISDWFGGGIDAVGDAARNVSDTIADAWERAQEENERMKENFRRTMDDISSIMGPVADLFGELFGSKAGRIFGAIADGGMQIARIYGGARAAGGPITGGRAYMVGERGPELVIPRSSGTVIPNHALRGSSNRSGPITFDMRGAVMTSDLLQQMQSMARESSAGAIRLVHDKLDRQRDRALA